MKKLNLFILLSLSLAVGIFLFSQGIIEDVAPGYSVGLPELDRERISLLLPESEGEAITPPPLQVEQEIEHSLLTAQGVIEWTNYHRVKNGLSPLRENIKLNESSRIKVSDMVENQYFSHTSPLGVGAGEVVSSVGYDYVIVGENLAVGDFSDDQGLVEGWMDSPGHRENILKENFQEIGVAVMRGEYKGRETWYAVQHFALPLSACPRPDQSLKEQIEQNKQEIEEIYQEINILREEIDAYQSEYGRGYNQKISEYNSLVSEYNSLIEETEDLIDSYNQQVNQFNSCI
ncbi:MAG: hypothetical protein GF370_02580 [Candidatus Nealsonbacteria bacterium]|nr:hypothetical protein [Candidatus Nealsonbacteria bacterium]